MNRKSTAKNILFRDVYDIPEVRVTMDTGIERIIIVCLKNGNIYKFKQCGEVRYYFDMK